MRRSKFSLSHFRNFTGNMGYAIPCGIVEVLPGDSFRHKTTALLRMSPMVSPVMHPVHVKIHHYYVPTRIVWDDFETFITGGPTGTDATVPPYITTPASTGFLVGSLADYLRVPPGVPSRQVSALPFRCYQTIMNEYYRDQDLQLVGPQVSKGSGSDTITNTSLFRTSWEKDYFTTARPFAQKGPDITIPIGTEAPVVSNGLPLRVTGATSGVTANLKGTAATNVTTASAMTNGEDLEFGNQGLIADLSLVTGIDVNDLRLLLALQRYEENRARFGSRYTEYLRNAFGVISSDARLQRPEYLGGGVTTVQFSEVLQTAEGENPVGEMYGHGIAGAKSNAYNRFFEEHGFVISIMIVRPIAVYADNLPRMYSRTTKEMYYQKELAHVGQQGIPNKEVQFGHADPEENFGWQDRYDDYRREESGIAGEFRDVLSSWTFARSFETDVALNQEFIQCIPSTDPFASTDTDQFYVMCTHSIKARRAIPKTGTSFIK